MTDERTRVVQYFETSRERDRVRFVALFAGDPGRAARALWGVFDGVAPPRLFAEPWVIDVLAADVTGVTGERALALFHALAAAAPRWLGAPGDSADDRGYPGWSKSLEALTRGLGDRAPLRRADVPGPVGQGVAFCLARLGEHEMPAESLAHFAHWAARRYSWVQEVFAGAERAFGEPAWRRAVVEAAVAPEITRVGWSADDFAPYVPFADDRALFHIATRLTWDEGAVAFFDGRGPAMAALLESHADANLAATGRLAHSADFALRAYAHGLRARGDALPARFEPLVAAQLRLGWRPTCTRALLRALDPARREAILLAWANDLVLGTGDPPEELTEFATPAIAAWAARAVVRDPDSHWLSWKIADFGPAVLDTIVDVEGLGALDGSAVHGFLEAAERHPSSVAAAVAGQFVEHPDERVRAAAAAALAAQAVEDVVAVLTARLPAGDSSADGVLAAVCAARCYEPELRALAARHAARLDAEAAAIIAPAIAELPAPVAAFVARAGAGDPRARALLTAARRGLHDAIVPDLALAAGDREAAWFCVFVVGRGNLHRMQAIVDGLGSAAVAPLLALWPHLAVDDQLRPWIVHALSRLDVQASLQLASAAAGSAHKPTQAAAHAAIVAALATPARPAAIDQLRAMLADKVGRVVALDVIVDAPVPEVLELVEDLARAPKLAKALSGSVDRALRLTRFHRLPPVTPAAVALRALAGHDVGLGGPVRKLVVRGPAVAAASDSELVVVDRRTLAPRARITGLAGDATAWDLAPDASWSVILAEDGLTLHDARGQRLVVDDPDGDDEDEDRRLYPNDGLAGALAVAPDRLLAWAIGHNVYDPLTLYAMPSGGQLADPTIDGFAYAIAATSDAFVVVRDDGTIERRDLRTGKRLATLGRVAFDDGWPELAIAGDGALIAVAITPGLHVFTRGKSGYRASVTLHRGCPDGSLLVASAATAHLAVQRDAELVVFDATGLPCAKLAPAHRPTALAFAGAALIVASHRTIEAIDLASLTIRAAFQTESDVTALVGHAGGWVAGCADGTVVTP